MNQKMPKYLLWSISSLFLIAIASVLLALGIKGFAYGLMVAGFISGLAGVLIGLSQRKK